MSLTSNFDHHATGEGQVQAVCNKIQLLETMQMQLMSCMSSATGDIKKGEQVQVQVQQPDNLSHCYIGVPDRYDPDHARACW